MKANEALEKIYLQPSEIKRLPYQNIFCVRPLADNSIEYTRTDAFVEKAEKWMKENFVNDQGLYCVITDYNTVKEMIEDFKNYMKEE
jgi:hypothetical protein